jgi:uncharacterized protein
MKKLSVLALLLAILATVKVAGSADIPYLTGRVNDYAGILTEDTRQLISEKLKEHEDRTTNQVVVLTIPSLQGESIEDYSNRVFNEWKLGQKDMDNGILIVVVPEEKRMRIEVGYGLEGTMPDILASRIIREVMTPRFREGDFDAGITDGAVAVMSILEGQELPEAEYIDETSGSSSFSGFSDLESPDMPIGARILLGAFIFGIIGLFTIIGIVTPGFGWFLYLFLIPFWAMFPIVVIGTKAALVVFFIYLIGYPSAKLYIRTTPWFKKAKKDLRTKGKASIGGFSFASGGSGGSWSSGSGGSSGGFSGGGGSSGGGGASGGW